MKMRKIKMKMKKNRASILIVSMLILAAILIIALSISLTASRDRQASMDSAKSNQAFFNAETGMESVLADLNGFFADPSKFYGVSSQIGGLASWDDSTKTIKGANWEAELKDAAGVKIADEDELIGNIEKIKLIGWDAGNGEKRAIEGPACSDTLATCDDFEGYENGSAENDDEMKPIGCGKVAYCKLTVIPEDDPSEDDPDPEVCSDYLRPGEKIADCDESFEGYEKHRYAWCVAEYKNVGIFWHDTCGERNDLIYRGVCMNKLFRPYDFGVENIDPALCTSEKGKWTVSYLHPDTLELCADPCEIYGSVLDMDTPPGASAF